MSVEEDYLKLQRLISTFRSRGWKKQQILKACTDEEVQIERFDDAWELVVEKEEQEAELARQIQAQAPEEDEPVEQEQELAHAHSQPSSFGTASPPEIPDVRL